MDYIFHIIATITSVFIGATAAFFWERLTRRKEREKELVAAGNRAIFIISRQFSVLNQLKAQIIDPVRNDPDAWVKMSAVLPRSHEDLRFDIGSLQFLLDSESPNILNELLVEEDRFFEAMKTINERSHKHYNELQPRMAELGIQAPSQHPANKVKQALGADIVAAMKTLTQAAIEHVDEGMDGLIKVHKKLRTSLKTIFPDKKIIDIKFAEGPEDKTTVDDGF